MRSFFFLFQLFMCLYLMSWVASDEISHNSETPWSLLARFSTLIYLGDPLYANHPAPNDKVNTQLVNIVGHLTVRGVQNRAKRLRILDLHSWTLPVVVAHLLACFGVFLPSSGQKLINTNICNVWSAKCLPRAINFKYRMEKERFNPVFCCSVWTVISLSHYHVIFCQITPNKLCHLFSPVYVPVEAIPPVCWQTWPRCSL